MLKPNLGSIYIDNINGSKIDASSWRNQIGYVSQEAIIFDESIANNISLWSGDNSQDSRIHKNYSGCQRSKSS